ncbi:MAG: pimeloyl-ACP methyl ester esterase BioH [Gammaproteobacteria bacterium]|nr:pimeloyl-ACP methyl ester esterase BioH [Gammaproteobacteria bacterium]MDE2272834.1 pimeloyl-ACP methyl ester esterase BioH [Gammaproteobacteria bacterium]
MSPNLHIETTGRGPDLFLIHGWALHGGVWDSLVPELARSWRVTRADLPGHGRSRAVPMPASLPELASLIVHAAPQTAVWLGWSLGGLVALQAALDFPERVRALILTGSTPRFVTAPDWDCAMPPQQLAEFRSELARDYRGAVQRFLALQVHGDARARAGLRQLRASLSACAEPDVQSLAAGLEILRTGDLRADVSHVTQPTLVLTGVYDRLVPSAAGAWLADAITGARLCAFPEAAHTPFLSYPRKFLVALQDFLTPLQVTAVPPYACGAARHG